MADDDDRMTRSTSTGERSTSARAILTRARETPGKIKEIDEMRAMVQASFAKVIPYKKNSEIIEEAVRLHGRLKKGDDEVGPKEKSAIAGTLLKMYEILDERIKNAPRDKEYFPVVEGIKWNRNDPLAQMGAIETINPFGWVDDWRKFIIKPATDLKREKKTVAKETKYVKNLKAGIEELKTAKFGRAEKYLKSPYWEIKPDPYPSFISMLVLKKREIGRGKPAQFVIPPSRAIDAMFGVGKTHKEDWSFDCSQWIQVAFLYALRHTLGEKGFNERIGTDFYLREQGSSGIRVIVNWLRNAPGGTITRNEFSNNVLKSTQPERDMNMDKILSIAPVGSRITWTNELKRGTDRNQNTIKLGEDKYATHTTSLKKIFSQKEIEDMMQFKFLKANVFISQIEFFDTPK